jgi:hypothetical protein
MRHVQVRRGGKLELIGIEIMDSTGSSALFSEGDLTVTNCSFSRCVAGTNDIMRSVDSAVTTGGAALRALGGAIQARGTEATLRSTGSSFVACAAQGAKFANHGGAVYAAAMVHIDTTRFDSNYVEGGSFETGGGALYIQARRLDIAVHLEQSNGSRCCYWGGGAFGRLHVVHDTRHRQFHRPLPELLHRCQERLWGRATCRDIQAQRGIRGLEPGQGRGFLHGH